MVVYFSPLVLFAISFFILETCKLEARISKFNRQRFHPYFMDTTICRTMPGLTKAQINLCHRQPNATLVALQGLNQAVNECQYQFQGHRWNCSSLKTRGQNPYISSILQKAVILIVLIAHFITSGPINKKWEMAIIHDLVHAVRPFDCERSIRLCGDSTGVRVVRHRKTATVTTDLYSVFKEAIKQKKKLRGYKESAFARAITSAGIAIAVAKGCSSGQLTNCGCDPKPYKMRKPRSMSNAMSDTKWKWGGCSHNIHYGVKFSKLFLDSRENAEDMQSNVNLHNNQVGRMAVSNNMQIKCKCHGISGSCELKTCWRAVPDFRVVGKELREKYHSAVLVDQKNLRRKAMRKLNKTILKNKKGKAKQKQWTPRKNKHKRDLSYDLLYYEKSPSFCEKEKSLDIQGTTGRSCNRTTTTETDSCSNLCCGRGYNLIKRKIVERCNCKFIWCCEVQCETCSSEEWISVCK